MTLLGSSEPAGNALRCSSSFLRPSSPCRPRSWIVHHSPRMTVTPPRDYRLWHPTRGISFSPGPAPLASPTRSPHIVAAGPRIGAGQYHTATSKSASTQSEEAWAATVLQQAAAPPPRPSPSLRPEQTGKYVSIPPNVEAVEAVEASVEAKGAEKKATGGPPPPVLEYKMVDDMFYAAKRSPVGSPGSFWSYSQYRRTAEDGSVDKVKVHYCRSRHTMERVCKQYFMDEKVLGFDLEWMPDATRRDGLKRNISLIQLASPSRIALFHVALFANHEDMAGPSFKSLMENPDVIKVGVSIKGDTTRLRNFLDIHSRGLMELSNLYRLVIYSRNHQYHNINKRLVPLATQVEEFLHLPLFKGNDVRLSNWFKVLNMDQILYSASDAYAGLHLYATLEHHRKQLDPCPPSPHFAELNLAIQLADGVKVAGTDDSIEPEDFALTTVQGPNPSNKCLSNAMGVVAIEDGENASPLKSPNVPKRVKRSPRPIADPAPITVISASESPRDSRIEVAENRVAFYRASHPEARSTFAQLRSYYLWHCYDLPPATIAQLVRSPPLKTETVVSYILYVVQAEKLPVDRDRLREIADFVPQHKLWARWPVVAGMTTTTAGDQSTVPSG
ncbi:putative 3 -5 exonuclease [Rosellinia necatrix]|uniref:Putative 3-5 exonuclease n=1 Tax=Rosellinia necatrix TaxID=77044 RepID=A0A1S7ULL4_ROSNE|nr:putative 3 -5 exonuclease [Rosellinia necatrix]